MEKTEPMSNGCLQCGHQNQPGTGFCRQCGASLGSQAGADAAHDRAASSSARGLRVLWTSLVAATAALTFAGGFWWLGQMRSAGAPTFDSAPPPSATASAASAPVSDLWEPIVPDAATATPEPASASVRTAASDASDTTSPARELAEGRSGLVRDPRARSVARSVQARCADRGTLMRAICEARECVGPEHAGELVCQRIRAADDRRREQ